MTRSLFSRSSRQ